MGILLTKLWRLFNHQEHKVIIVGLDNAGKTTILYQFSMNEVVHTSPTIGSNVEEIVVNNTHFLMWDIGGQESLRSSWNTYYTNTEFVIVVVDSTDRERISVTKEELYRMLAHEDLRKAGLLIFANKQDVKGRMSVAEISQSLQLTSIKDHQWHIQACCALTGEGLDEIRPAGMLLMTTKRQSSRGRASQNGGRVRERERHSPAAVHLGPWTSPRLLAQRDFGFDVDLILDRTQPARGSLTDDLNRSGTRSPARGFSIPSPHKLKPLADTPSLAVWSFCLNLLHLFLSLIRGEYCIFHSKKEGKSGAKKRIRQISKSDYQVVTLVDGKSGPLTVRKYCGNLLLVWHAQ
ncbi:hypothetical protein F2P81_021510 [Scophthalmus maximus]|uniref:ADP-ribosylation factor-like protein 5A n=1 Tax=Scophthalmus maximus TaxID=52904 RepID=A0A6A4RXE6_SCOMX|nr:hypothetical protein F2P81_021510 [Scophthalmus maximus]